jgi:hypothetical protein
MRWWKWSLKPLKILGFRPRFHFHSLVIGTVSSVGYDEGENGHLFFKRIVPLAGATGPIPDIQNLIPAPFVVVSGRWVGAARYQTTWFEPVNLDITYMAVHETNHVFGVIEH